MPDNQVALSGGDNLWLSRGDNIEQIINNSGDDLFNSFTTLAQNAAKLSGDHTIESFLWYEWLRGDTWYSARLNTDNIETGNGPYFISYLRKDFRDALDSSVTLPEEFTITAPLAAEMPSRGNDIVINWQPSGIALEMQLGIFINCSTGSGNTLEEVISIIGDPGSYTIPGGSLDIYEWGNCTTTFTVAKYSVGEVDSALYGGRIMGERFQTVTLTTSD